MSLSVHTLMQNSDYLNAMRVGASEEDYVASLWKLAISLSNGIGARCNLRCLCEAPEGIKQLSNVAISLSLAPLSKCMFRNLSQIGVCCPREPEGSHSC